MGARGGGRPAIDLIAASAAAAGLLAQRQGRATVAELADAAGISVRSYHRHFPTKEDVLRPLFQEAAEEMAQHVRDQSANKSVIEAFLSAWDRVAGGDFTER